MDLDEVLKPPPGDAKLRCDFRHREQRGHWSIRPVQVDTDSAGRLQALFYGRDLMDTAAHAAGVFTVPHAARNMKNVSHGCAIANSVIVSTMLIRLLPTATANSYGLFSAVRSPITERLSGDASVFGVGPILHIDPR